MRAVATYTEKMKQRQRTEDENKYRCIEKQRLNQKLYQLAAEWGNSRILFGSIEEKLKNDRSMKYHAALEGAIFVLTVIGNCVGNCELS